MKASATSATSTATAEAAFIILGIAADSVPATLSKAETLPLRAVSAGAELANIDTIVDTGPNAGASLGARGSVPPLR